MLFFSVNVFFFLLILHSKHLLLLLRRAGNIHKFRYHCESVQFCASKEVGRPSKCKDILLPHRYTDTVTYGISLCARILISCIYAFDCNTIICCIFCCCSSTLCFHSYTCHSFNHSVIHFAVKVCVSIVFCILK